MWQAPHRDHSLVIEVYRMVIKQRGALISPLQPECLTEALGLDRKGGGGCEERWCRQILGNATTLFWGIMKSAFVLDKSLTPL